MGQREIRSDGGNTREVREEKDMIEREKEKVMAESSEHYKQEVKK